MPTGYSLVEMATLPPSAANKARAAWVLIYPIHWTAV